MSVSLVPVVTLRLCGSSTAGCSWDVDPVGPRYGQSYGSFTVVPKLPVQSNIILKLAAKCSV